MKRNNFFAIEGIDGSGKSTVVNFLKEKLIQTKYTVKTVMTREASRETLFSEIVKNYNIKLNSREYMFLFQFLHADKCKRTIDHLDNGDIVIADRWDLSFFAWHNNFGFLSKENASVRENISKIAFPIEPIMGFYLDIPIEKAINRRIYLRKDTDIKNFEDERKFFEPVVSTYKSLVKKRGWKIIDANSDPEIVGQSILDEIIKKIENPVF